MDPEVKAALDGQQAQLDGFRVYLDQVKTALGEVRASLETGAGGAELTRVLEAMDALLRRAGY